MQPPKYILEEFVTDEDHPDIDSVLVTDDAVNRHNRIAIIATFAIQDVDFDDNDISIGLRMSEVAASTVKLFSLNWDPVYESMPVEQDQVCTIISSVSNTLEPLSFYYGLETNAVASKLKISVGATSIIPPYEPDDLWTSGEPWNLTIDISTIDCGQGPRVGILSYYWTRKRCNA